MGVTPTATRGEVLRSVVETVAVQVIDTHKVFLPLGVPFQLFATPMALLGSWPESLIENLAVLQQFPT